MKKNLKVKFWWVSASVYIVVERARDYMIQQILGSIEETHHTAGINRVLEQRFGSWHND